MRLSVGKAVDSFVATTITSDELVNATNSSVLVYLDKETNDRLIDFYKGVKAVLRNKNNELLLLLSENKSNIEGPIVNLCLQYGCYNIYRETPGISVNKTYCDELLSRKPSLKEVEMYVSRDSVAVETIDELLVTIRSMCVRGQVDELREYVMQNLTLIDELPGALTQMKGLLDPTAKVREEDFRKLADELQKSKNALDSSMQEARKLTTQLNDKEVVITQLQTDLKNTKDKLERYTESLSKSLAYAKELEGENKNLQSAIKQTDSVGLTLYNTIRISSIPNCKAKAILYFKEIGRPRYFNSFVWYLASTIKKIVQKGGAKSEKVKILIYDTRKDFSGIYRNQHVYSEDNYFTERLDAITRQTVIFLDVNPSYLSDMLTNGGSGTTSADYEYFIIVDRLGHRMDLVEGPSVAKFYTFSSSSEYLNFIKTEQISKCEGIFPGDGKGIEGTIELQTIMDYPTTETAAFVRWYKMPNPSTGNAVFDDVLSKIGLKK